MAVPYSDDPQGAFRRLRATGRAALPREPVRAALTSQRMLGRLQGDWNEEYKAATRMESPGRSALRNSGRMFGAVNRGMLEGLDEGSKEEIIAMSRRRTSAVGMGSAALPASGHQTDAALAWPKIRDPWMQFREKTWWWLDPNNFESSLGKVRDWARLIVMTHPLIPSLIDIYSRWPVADIEFRHHDKAIACTPAETPIWMSDYSFKPISQVVAGDEVIGWDYSGGKKARLRRSKVTETFRYRNAPILKVTMESGRTLRCTSDHKWANNFFSPGRAPIVESSLFSDREAVRMRAAQMFSDGVDQKDVAQTLGVSRASVSRWSKAWDQGGAEALQSQLVRDLSGTEQRYGEWVTPRVGAVLRHVIDPTPELASEKERLVAAWLGGIYDGEGSGKFIAQDHAHNPDVYQRIIDSLEFLGFRAYEHPHGHVIGFHQDRGSWTTHQSRQDLVDFLNQTGPTRRTSREIDRQLLSAEYGQADRIVSIEPDGIEDVYALTTETGNYVAWGFASSNSYYNELFLDQLHYDEFLFDVGHEFWTVGEAFPLGSWHDGIGAWDDDQLIMPEDVDISPIPFLSQHEFRITVPETIKEIVDKREPHHLYNILIEMYPDVVAWAKQDEKIPVSDVLMKQLKFKMNPWHLHGIPILMRAFTTLQLEMSLNAAQDAIADRLYSPLILAQLGLEQFDEEGPWVPDADDIQSLRDDLSLTLLSDFRVMVYHHGLNIQNAFGREQMPRLGDDFDRVDMRLMQIFGIGQELLQGGQSGVPYASGALNRDLLSNMLMTWRGQMKQFLKDRVAVVAERQEHYEYETVAGRRIPVMETALMLNEETGEEYVVERPKLAIPEPQFRSVNLNDPVEWAQLLLTMKEQGIPIASRTIMTNIPLDFDEQVEATAQEKVELEMADLEHLNRLFTQIFMAQAVGKNIPVPAEYAQTYEAWVARMQTASPPMPIPDVTSPPASPSITGVPAIPGGMVPGAPAEEEGGEAVTGVPQRPEESDDQRKRQGFKVSKRKSPRKLKGNGGLASPPHLRGNRERKRFSHLASQAMTVNSNDAQDEIDEEPVLGPAEWEEESDGENGWHPIPAGGLGISGGVPEP